MERSEVRDAPAATLANPSAQAPSLSLHVRLGRVLCSGTGVMLAGTVVATIGAYVFQLLGGRALGPTAFAPVTVLWTVQFLVITVVMLPIEQMVIRRLDSRAGDQRDFGTQSHRSPRCCSEPLPALGLAP